MTIQEVMRHAAVRITPQEAYSKVKAGQAILVCGYEDEEKFKAMRLERAISFAGFQKMLPVPAEGQ